MLAAADKYDGQHAKIPFSTEALLPNFGDTFLKVETGLKSREEVVGVIELPFPVEKCALWVPFPE